MTRQKTQDRRLRPEAVEHEAVEHEAVGHKAVGHNRSLPLVLILVLSLTLVWVSAWAAISSGDRSLGTANFVWAEFALGSLRETSYFAGEMVRAESEEDEVVVQLPSTYKKMNIPKANPITKAKVELGKQLYFDKRLSADDSISCASCHDPQHGWSEPAKHSTGFNGLKGNRNAPTILNSSFSVSQFWDGRAASLEDQALGPIQNPIEMNMPLEQLEKKLSAIVGYQEQFQAVFGTQVNREGIALALAAFERTIVSGEAAYDRFKAGDQQALSPSAAAGMKLFFGKANCSACHAGGTFSNSAFHNIGIGIDSLKPDLGRFVHSNLEGDLGSFKVPSLRDIALTAPYMHDGSLATLEEVVDYYNKGGTDNPQLDEEIYSLGLSDQQKADLITFLKEALTSEQPLVIDPPNLPQSVE